MTITKAIKRANDRVSICPQGGQYVLQTWSPQHNATLVDQPTTYSAAAANARYRKICIALEALGIEDAGAEAYMLAQEDGRWVDLVRGYWRDRA